MKTVYSNNCKISDYNPIYKQDSNYVVCFNKYPSIITTKVLRNGRYENEKATSTNCGYNYILFDHKPNVEEIKKEFNDIINESISKKIKRGFIYDGKRIHLTKENQMNYKTNYDLAIQTYGQNLPYKIKCENNGKTEYLVFETTAEFTKFYLDMNKHINNCLEEGWKRKDSIDYSQYVQ